MSSSHPKQQLSRERILAAAISVADGEGLRAVTMRRVAEDLGCEAMSLYYYVADKGALTTGMVEAVIGEVVAASSAITLPDWRGTIGSRCLAAREVMLGHSWAPVPIAQQTESPVTSFALYEEFVGTLVGAGFTYDLAHRAIHALGSMVLGFSNELFDPEPGEEIDEEAMREMAAALPHLSQMAMLELHEEAGSLSMCDTQAEFEFTLALLLDGLEAKRLALS